ncbi:hypothetical protein V5N11_020811 [Cardamine amara subsp. amara]|uniref:Retrotransposon Copia-like N-terminal domain-containing protein n=1 Tax=Cardamine amara subsp. amara TaxID=228776 RepID=A0ABD1AI29_CARAN
MSISDEENEASIVSEQNKNNEPQRRTISPYNLSFSDNSGTAILQPLLRGPEYDEWAKNFRQDLLARKKYGFVYDSIPMSSEEPCDREWLTNNTLTGSWIKVTIDPKVCSNIAHHDVAHDLWEHINKHFSVKTEQRVQRRKAELETTRQKGLTIEGYYGKMITLWSALAEFNDAIISRSIE